MIERKRPAARSTKRRASARRKGDPKYLDWIRGLACLVCTTELIRSERPDSYPLQLPYITRTESAHVGDRGLGQKCSDRETIPLCATHHRLGKDAHHVLGKGFWAHHGIDRDATIKELNRLYDQENQ